MEVELLAYPFLFVAIFFESFVLVTFLSKPARAARARVIGKETPSVAVIVPCYNEASTVAGTCESLLALDYPQDKFKIILVDDGSTDATPEAMAHFSGNPQVQTIRKENGGKHTALNAGITFTDAEFIGCLDADSFVEPGALREIIPCFQNPRIAAVTAAMSVHKPGNLLQHMQNAEYIFGITLRHALSTVDGLYVTPGPFSFYRRSVIEELGGFRKGYNTEDMEMALRIQRAGYGIDNALRARVYTKAPQTVARLLKQRTRWTTGFIRNVLGEYRGLIGSRNHSALGMIILPLAIVAIISGITLFVLAIGKLIQHAVMAFQVRAGIPLTYIFTPRASFDWFYFPANLYLFLAIATVLASFALIIIGKRISNTPGSVVLGLVSYLFLYGFIVPFWLIRSVSDVALGIHRTWR